MFIVYIVYQSGDKKRVSRKYPHILTKQPSKADVYKGFEQFKRFSTKLTFKNAQ